MPGETKIEMSLDPDFLKKVLNVTKAKTRDRFKAIQKDAKSRARAQASDKATGENADSIGIKVRSYPAKVWAAISSNSGHGGYVELGTSKMQAQPSIQPAVDAGLKDLGDEILQGLEELAEGYSDVPDLVIQNAVSKLKTSQDKGPGIIGARDAKKKARSRRGKT